MWSNEQEMNMLTITVHSTGCNHGKASVVSIVFSLLKTDTLRHQKL